MSQSYVLLHEWYSTFDTSSRTTLCTCKNQNNAAAHATMHDTVNDYKMMQRIVNQQTQLPHTLYPWEECHGRSCENIVGYTIVPTGTCGPACIEGVEHIIPMATTEVATEALVTMLLFASPLLACLLSVSANIINRSKRVPST